MYFNSFRGSQFTKKLGAYLQVRPIQIVLEICIFHCLGAVVAADLGFDYIAMPLQVWWILGSLRAVTLWHDDLAERMFDFCSTYEVFPY